jgi:hypothetical protein
MDRFIIVFFAVVAITLACGLMCSAIALYGPDPPPPLLEKSYAAWQEGFVLGLGAIFGLLAGKFG